MSETGDLCKVWTRFESKQKDGGVIKLRIQDLPSDRQHEVIDFMLKYYVPDEPFHRAAGVSHSQEALQEYRSIMEIVSKRTKSHIAMCCIDDETGATGHILGMSVMQLTKKSDDVMIADFIKELNIRTKEVQRLFHIIEVLKDHVPEHKYDTYYDGRGVMIHPDYRGLGIANELVRVRKMVCVDHGVPMTCAWMTAIGTQKAAEKQSWKTYTEISLEELDKLTGFTFEKTIPTYKLMYTTAN